MFRVILTNDNGPGRRFGAVIDEQGAEIGTAHDYPYGGRGFAVHTREFGGFVPVDSVEFVRCPVCAATFAGLVEEFGTGRKVAATCKTCRHFIDEAHADWQEFTGRAPGAK